MSKEKTERITKKQQQLLEVIGRVGRLDQHHVECECPVMHYYHNEFGDVVTVDTRVVNNLVKKKLAHWADDGSIVIGKDKLDLS